MGEQRTIRIFQMQPGTYVYAVQALDPCDEDEEGCDETPITESGAVVRLFQGDMVLRAYEIPTEGSGRWWEVFRLSSDGTITDVNQVGPASADPYREQIGVLDVAFYRPRHGDVPGGCVEAKDADGNAVAACDGDPNDANPWGGQLRLERVPFGEYAVTLTPPPGYEMVDATLQTATLTAVRDSARLEVATVPTGTRPATLTIRAASCPFGTNDPVVSCAGNALARMTFYDVNVNDQAQTDPEGVATFAELWPGPVRVYPGSPGAPYGYYVRCEVAGSGEVLFDGSTSYGGVEFIIPDGALVTCRWFQLTAPATLGMSVTPQRGSVGGNVEVAVTGFPPNYGAALMWDDTYLTSVGVDPATGNGMASFRVPAAPKGVHTVTALYDQTITRSTTFEVVPRVKLLPGSAARGETVAVSLRGYAARTEVRVRWHNGTTWVEVARVTTSRTGSANVEVIVPAWAPDGPTQIRGDALTSDGGRAQTNAFVVSGGPLAANVVTPTPTTTVVTTTPTETPPAAPSSEPTLEASLTPDGIPSSAPTVTPEPTVTPSPTSDPAETPQVILTVTPTLETVATQTPATTVEEGAD
jgi:hypothetical protein